VHYFTWSVDVLVDGVWVAAYSATPAVENQWVEIAFAQGILTQLRLRAHNNVGGSLRLFLFEVDAHDSAVSP
jgi:hypothetical protein